MEACIVICRTRKEAARRGKILFIDAKLEVTRKNTESWLEDSHIKAAQLPYKEAIRDKILYNANNPVKANLCKSAFGYKYSSLRVFTLRPWVWKSLITIDKNYILDTFGTLDNLKENLSKEIEYTALLKK